MSVLMMRAALLAQGGSSAPPIGIESAWELDVTRRPAGYTLSDANRTAINTSGGANYLGWVPTARAILPWDGRRYWEVLCASGGAATFDGFMGVVSAAQREEFTAGLSPITLGSIGWRGNGTLWSSNTALAIQQLAGLPPHGAGDVLMFVLDPAHARLWIGKNGVWRDDPVSGAPTWTSSPGAGFHPQIQGRSPGDGGTLRSLPAQFSFPVPSGTVPLALEEPDLRIFEAQAFLEFGAGPGLGIGTVEAWLELGGGPRPTADTVSTFLDLGGQEHPTAAQAALYIEVELP